MTLHEELLHRAIALALPWTLIVSASACRTERKSIERHAEQLAPVREPTPTIEQQARRPEAAMNPVASNRLPAPTPSAAKPVNLAPEGEVSFRLEGVAAGDVLNIRDEPDATSMVEGAIPVGTTHVQGLGPPKTLRNATWQRVRYGGVEGWVNARFLRLNAGGPPPQQLPPAKMELVAPLYCFGDEPVWNAVFSAEGTATFARIDGTPPVPLRVADIMTMNGGPGSFDLVGPEGDVWLSVLVAKTGRCFDGESDDPHPYEFIGTGQGRKYTGCCRPRKH